MKKIAWLLIVVMLFPIASGAVPQMIDLEAMSLEEIGNLQHELKARANEIANTTRNEEGRIIQFTGYEITKKPTAASDGKAIITVENCSNGLTIMGLEILMGRIDRFGDRAPGYSYKFYDSFEPGEIIEIDVNLVQGDGITTDVIRAFKILIEGDVVIDDGWDLYSDVNWLTMPRD